MFINCMGRKGFGKYPCKIPSPAGKFFNAHADLPSASSHCDGHVATGGHGTMHDYDGPGLQITVLLKISQSVHAHDAIMNS